MTADVLQETQQYTASQAGTIAKAWTGNTTTGSAIHVLVIANAAGGGNHTGISDSQSNTYTKLAEYLSTGSTFRVSHWVAVNITGGTTPTVTASFQYATASERGIIIREIGGVTADPLDGYIGQYQATPTTTTDALTTGSGAGSTNDTQPAFISAMAVCISWNAVPAAGTGFTAGQSLSAWSTGGAARTEHKRITATGAQAATFTAGYNTQHISVMAIFDEAAATTKYLKALIASAAAGATNVAGTVFLAPSGSDICGAKVGEFSGMSFLGSNSLDGGKAKLLVNVSSFGVNSLTTANTPHVYVRTSSFDTGIFPATVIEV